MKYILILLTLCSSFTFTIGQINQYSFLQKVTASNSNNSRNGNDKFGFTVSISGNFAAVGAPSHEFDASGNNNVSQAGAVFIYEKKNGTWALFQKITAPSSNNGRNSGDKFGDAVNIDGNYLVVGSQFHAYDSLGNNQETSAGAAYVYERNGSSWNFVKKLSAPSTNNGRNSGDNFGASVSISGNTIVIGAKSHEYDVSGSNKEGNAGAIYIYERVNGDWRFVQKITTPNSNNGRNSQDFFGISVSIDGDYLVAGSEGQDYDSLGNNQEGSAGAAYVYERNGASWSLVKKLSAPSTNNGRNSGDNFGFSVSINGKTIIVGAKSHDFDVNGANQEGDAGAAYIYERVIGNWGFVQKIAAPNANNGRNSQDFFGESVSISENYILVGSQFQDYDSLGNNQEGSAGAAYVYEKNGASWSFIKKLSAPSINNGRNSGDNFGHAVSIDKNNILIGANSHDFDVNGSNQDNDAGAIYFYENLIDTADTLASFSIIIPIDSSSFELGGDTSTLPQLLFTWEKSIPKTGINQPTYTLSFDTTGSSAPFSAFNAGTDTFYVLSYNDARTFFNIHKKNTVLDASWYVTASANSFNRQSNNKNTVTFYDSSFVDTLSTFKVVVPQDSSSFELGGDTSTLPQLLFTWEKSIPKTGINQPTYTLSFDTAGSSAPFSTFNAGTDTFYVLSYADARVFFNNFKKNDILNANWFVTAEANGFKRRSDNKHIITFYDSSSTVGVTELNRLLKLYPNPTSSYLNIEFSKGIEKIKLHTITGQRVFEEIYDNMKQVTINLSGFKSGIYLIEVNTTIGVVAKRIEISSE